jgi:hypothetical protein
MTFEEEKEHVKREHPRVWEWLLGVDNMQVSLPTFNDDDEPDYRTKEEQDNDIRD